MAAAFTEHIASPSVRWLLKSDTGSKPTAVYAQAPGCLMVIKEKEAVTNQARRGILKYK